MGKYIKSTLVCMVCFVSSVLFGNLLWSFTIQLVIYIAMSPSTIRELLASFSRTAVVCVFLFITMHRNGYSGNKSYEKEPVIKLIIPIIISVLLLPTLSILYYTLIDFYEDSSALSEFLQTWLRSIPHTIFMIVGYHIGYKKREKDRKEMMNSTNNK